MEHTAPAHNALSHITIRPIEPGDNAAIARVIRTALEEFGANKPGTVYFDPTTDDLYRLFRQPRSAYFIALDGNEVLGGAGIYPTEGLPAGTAELVKMYLRRSARGLGLGRLLIQRCIDHARAAGYEQVYLESMPELQQALKTYEKFGFRYLDGPLGNSGHFGCGLWMLRAV